MELASVDWIILAVVALSALVSVIRGFIKEAMSLVIWVLAFIVAMNFKGQVADLLINVIELPSIRQAVAWIALFAGILLAGGMVNYVLGKLVSSTGLSGTDRLLGLVFGMARGLVIVLALVVLLPQILPVDQDYWWQESAFIPKFQEFETWGRETASAVKSFLLSWI